MGLHKFDNKKEIKKLDFKKNKVKYIKIGTICISFLVVIISIIYFTYSKFTLTDVFKTAESTVGTFLPADYVVNYYIDDEHVSNKPSSGNYDIQVTCDKGATGTWNNEDWSINISSATEAGIKCNVNFTTIKDYQDATGASTPELYAGLIPITYDDSNNILVADTTSEWYNYYNHEWANAILIDQSNATTKAKYINEDGSFKSGTIVSISDVLQMYVWIPRYKYKLFNATGASTSAQMIEVEFENIDTPKSSGSTNGEWLTHPAFTFGETELNGIWVGKFEPSGSTSEIKIIPNVSSLRSITLGAVFNASRAIEATTKYGLSSDEIDTHVMKNMEWGAVAYLTNSKYGRYIDASTCIDSGCEVWINPNSNFTTGCAGSSVSASETSSCYQWNTATGVKASTTGNIYGIYDMSGGAWDYTMGSMVDSSGRFYPASSGLSQLESKYYDSYAYATSYTDYSRGKLGDATKEVNGWNADRTWFVYSSESWFVRGGSYYGGSDAGVFHFDNYTGGTYSYDSFRVVLVSA